MASPLKTASFLFLSLCVFSTVRCVLSENPPQCRDQSAAFLYALKSQSPASISPTPHLEVDGDSLDKLLSSKKQNTFTAVLFYASWCPFSQRVYPMFDVLSSIFPQIEHLAIEQSSALPSVFSRYGIHSLPSVLFVNQHQRFKYYGPKNLHSLMEFYQGVTGTKPISNVTDEQETNGKDQISLSWRNQTLKNMLKNEPYLVFSVMFLCLKLLSSILPVAISCLKAFWVSCLSRINLEMFGGTRNVLGRILHVVDVRRYCMRLIHLKTRNFHEGAKSARVWASSLATVSLGESSSARSSSS